MTNKKFDCLIKVFLFPGLFFLFFLSPTDPDLGWQIRCGEEIWTQGKICSPNHFSILLDNFNFVNHSTGYQLIVYPLYHLFNFWGLSLLNTLILTLSFYLLLKLPGNKNLKILSIPLVIFFSWSTLAFGIRSQILGFLFFMVTLFLLESKQENKKRYLTPIVIFFWANSHGSFILGIILLFALLFQKTVFFWNKQIQRKEYISYLTIVGLSIFASFFNPFTYRIYTEAWRHFYTVKLNTLIAEWVPPNFYYQLIILFLFILNLGIIIKKSNLKSSIFKIAVLTLLMVLSLKARRNLPFFFIFAAYAGTSFEIKVKNVEFLVLLAAMGIFLTGVLFQIPKTIAMNTNFAIFYQQSSPRYSYEAVEFLKNQSEKGNIFNTYEQGGFLVWQLPDYKVFVDGRMPAWETPSGQSPYTIYLEILQTQPGWQETLKEHQIDWLFIGPNTFMDIKIKDNPKQFGWKEVYRDRITVIYKKL